MAETYTPNAMKMERPSEEELLLTHLDRVRENASGCFAVHLHLSKLRPGNRQPHFLDIASRSLRDFSSGNDTVLFRMYNRDLVMVCRNILIEDVDPVVEKIRALFPEDPLTQAPMGSYDDLFTTWHDLSQAEDFRDFSAIINDQAAVAATEREKDKEEQATRAAAADLGIPLSPENLAAIDQKMKKTQIADLIQNQPVYRVVPGEKGEIVFREYFIAMGELKARVAPNVNFFASPWLFQYLTETLDRRMLSVISRRNIGEAVDNLSLNLNIATVVSREFQQFHEQVEEHSNRFVVEMQVIDIFSDTNAYKYARDFLHERGYRVLVDGLNPLAIHFFDPSLLQSDFLKISWGPEFVGDEKAEKIEEMRSIVRHAGKDGVILSRVDSQEAVQWGATLGISRFQGYFIDKLVTAMRAQKTARKTG